MSTISMSWNSQDNCFVCDAPASNIIFNQLININNNQYRKEYFACHKCYDIVQSDIIPKDSLKIGIISNYHYYGENTEEILSRKSVQNSVKAMIGTKIVDVALSCSYRPHYIVVDLDSKIPKYYVPIFYIDRKRRRSYATVHTTDLEELYRNNNQLGYYEINKAAYKSGDLDDMRFIDHHNRCLFDMMLKYNVLANEIINIAYKDVSKISNYLGLLPVDIIYMIIRLIFRLI